ncbi:MAG: ATP-binding cassette domain-containing protein [Cytophagales bacterium]|nr:ATP-binding cassette domain-containing protein [Cytophagales bacterium]
MDSTILSLQDVNVYQEGGQQVLENVNFKIDKGEFVYLLGRTGSGKSSLLKTLYADLPLTKGNIDFETFKLHDIESNKIPFLRRKLGIIFQDFQLFYDRTVFENLEFVLRATGWTGKAKIKSRISEVLIRVGLGSSESKMPHQLSGGEQQRVVIARALLNEPLLLIADEPTGNLDPEVAGDIMNLFHKINNSGTAILMATHNHNFLTSHPARILTCKDGKISDSKA